MLRRTPLARYTLQQLAPSKIAEFRDDRLKAGKSRSTVRSYLKLLSRAITIGRKELEIPLSHNPFELVEKPKPNAARERTLEHHELKKLFKACSTCSLFHFLGVFAEVAYLTLCRRGELLRLKRGDVDFINRIAILRKTKADKPRTIALAPRVIELLKALPRTVDGIFFPVRSISAFEKAFSRAVERAGITDFHMHDLRHCGAQHLIEDEGWNTIELMQQGGWTSGSMAKRYANISPKHLAKKLSR
jgi:integrase